MKNKQTKLISVSKTRLCSLCSGFYFFLTLKMRNIFLIRGLEVANAPHDSEHRGPVQNTRNTFHTLESHFCTWTDGFHFLQGIRDIASP